MDVGVYWVDFIVRMLLLFVRDVKNFKICLYVVVVFVVGVWYECLILAYVDFVSVLTLSLEVFEI